MTLPRIFIISLICTCLLADDVKTLQCFTVSQARPEAIVVADGAKASATSFGWSEKKALTFTARGNTASRAIWKIPLAFAMPVQYDISFAVQTRNVKSPGNRPNIYILLSPSNKSGDLLPRKVAAFTAGGIDGKELGSTRFACPEGYIVDSAVIDVYLASDGEASLTIESFEMEHQTNLPTEDELEKQLKRWRGARATMTKNGKGLATLQIEKKAVSFDGIDFGVNPQPALVKRLESTGAYRLNHVTIPLGGEESLWELPGYFNSRRLASIVRRASAPNTVLVLQVDLSNPPKWWSPEKEKHSDYNTSWLNYCKDALKYMTAALAADKLDSQVAGVLLKLSSNHNGLPLGQRLEDPGLNSHFRDWLKNRYFDNTALAQAWKKPQATFKTAQFIPPSRWPRGLLGPLGPQPDPVTQDSITFYQESWDGYNLDLNKHLKELTAGGCLTGYTLHPNRFKLLWDNVYYKTAGIKIALSSDSVDFIEIPYWDPDFLPVTPFDVDKPVLVRLDITNLTKPQSLVDMARLAYCSADGIDGVIFETNRLMSLTDKDFVKELKTLQTVRRKTALATRKAELAFVIDPEFLDSALPITGVPITIGTPKAASPPRVGEEPTSLHYLYETAQKLWPYSGMPYDIVDIDELDPDMEYRVLVFFHCVRMNPDRIKRINAMKKAGRTLVWSWADTLMAENKFAVSSVKAITGINIRLSPKPQRLFMLPTTALADFLEKRQLGSTPGGIVSPFEPHAAEEKAFAPSFEINDPSVDVWAMQIDSGLPAMATRKFFRWRSVYSCSPAINPEIIRAAALKSDAHVYYYQNDPFRLNDEFIVIHARSDGPRSLKFDEAAQLFEVFGDLEFKASTSHQFKVTKGKTYLFYRGNKADWLKLSAN